MKNFHAACDKLSDGSLVHSVCGTDDSGDKFIAIDCDTEAAANQLADLLTKHAVSVDVHRINFPRLRLVEQSRKE